MNGELQFVAAFLAGLVGSSHCIGMCGAIVVLFEQAGTERTWSGRLLYNAGRLGFYVTAGIVAGAGGAVLIRATGMETTLVVLRLIAGFLVIAIGLNLLFDLSLTRFLETTGARLWARVAPLRRYVMPMNTPIRALGAGFLWGALPCGLVYSAVAMAATTGNAAAGGLTMLAFWAGTAPALLLAGASAERLGRWRSTRPVRVAAGSVMLVVGALALMPIRMLLH